MNPLSSNEFRTLLSAVHKIYALTDIEQFPVTVLSALRQVLPCNTICYNDVNIPESRMSWITEPVEALPSPTLQEMFNRYLHEHPLITRSGSTGPPKSQRISDFLSKRQFHRLALYNEYYRPLGVEYQLGLMISMSDVHVIAIAFDRDHPDFSESERLCLDLLGPHLRQAYRHLQMMKLMKNAVEGKEKKSVIVDRTGQVEFMNEDVRRIFSRYFRMERFQNSLPDELFNWIKHERLRLCRATDLSSPSVPLAITKEGRQIMIHFLWGGKDANQDMLVMEEKAAETDAQMTRRESEILALLSQGKTNAEIGSVLSISPLTVKKHLEHIYSKLQVHRRAGAVARTAYPPIHS